MSNNQFNGTPCCRKNKAAICPFPKTILNKFNYVAQAGTLKIHLHHKQNRVFHSFINAVSMAEFEMALQ
jgi:hypothetical protein